MNLITVKCPVCNAAGRYLVVHDKTRKEVAVTCRRCGGSGAA